MDTLFSVWPRRQTPPALSPSRSGSQAVSTPDRGGFFTARGPLARLRAVTSLLLALTFVAPGMAAAGEIPTQRVSRGVVAEQDVLTATVEAVEQATVAAQVPGRLLETRVDAGARVVAGQVLARIDASEADEAVAAARARVAQAEAGAVNARAQYERTRDLHARKFVAAAALDQAQAAQRAAEAELAAARAALGQTGAARGHAEIRAPFDGIVAERLLEAGEMAQPGRALFSLYRPGRLRVVAQLPQARLAALGESRASLRARVELPEQGRTVDATAVTLLPSADPRTHGLTVRADLPADAAALPGAYARLMVYVGEAPRLTLPVRAVLRRGELTAAYVRDGGGFRLRQLRLGRALDGDQVEVLAGLKEGDEVALDPVAAGIAAPAR